MPFKSEAQRKKFQQLVKDGKITQAVYDAFESETGNKKLPDKVGESKKRPTTIEDLKKHFKEKYGR